MQDRKSIYSLNKADGDAIVYIDAEGHTIRLTRRDFATAEEFENGKRGQMKISIQRKRATMFTATIRCV